MKAKSLRIGWLTLTALVCVLLVASCGKTMVSGKVVDAETNKPVPDAAVHIFWTKPGSGPPGLRGEVKVDMAETLTDSAGRFEVPKYNTYSHTYNMAVYKTGFVCWSSRKVFPTYEERRDFKLKNGMKIQLEHFNPEYSRSKHAYFTLVASVGRIGGGLFDRAIKDEMRIVRKNIRTNRGK